VGGLGLGRSALAEDRLQIIARLHFIEEPPQFIIPIWREEDAREP
jgi:hypothetical protein